MARDVAEITCRHHAELATAWWRRENSPFLLLRGQPSAFHELDSKMLAYMDGAGLNTERVFARLLATQIPTAHDFVADMVAAFLMVSAGEVGPTGNKWQQTVASHPENRSAFEAARRWLGRKGVMPGDQDSEDVVAWHPPQQLRFIDGRGVVRGHYLGGEPAAGKPAANAVAPHVPRRNASELCTHALRGHRPGDSPQWIEDAGQQGVGEAVILLVVGTTGDVQFLDWILGHAAQPQSTLLALDAYRRITGFDALQSVGVDRQLPSTLPPEALVAARSNALAWHGQQVRYWHKDTAYFLGQPLTRTHLQQVLQTGYQVDRELAAMHLLQHAQPCAIPVRSNLWVQHRFMAKHFLPEEST